MNTHKEVKGFDTNPIKRRNVKIMACSLSIILCIMLLLQGCHSKSDKTMDIAIKKVSELFVEEDQENIKEGTAGKIKDSVDQEQIEHALEAVEKIDIGDDVQSEESMLVFGLISAIVQAQYQLTELEGTKDSSDNNAQADQEVERYHLDKHDIVLKNNQLNNKDALEDFIEVSEENSEDLESEIRIVIDEGLQGVRLYDLQARYDKNADQRWIDVTPDMNYFNPSADDTQDVFNNAPQQCASFSKDDERGYYMLHECRTHWEYPLLPIVTDVEE